MITGKGGWHKNKLAFMIFTLLGILQLSFGPSAQAQMLTGSYTGNGMDNRPITGPGFQPDVLIIKAADEGVQTTCPASAMTGNSTKSLGTRE